MGPVSARRATRSTPTALSTAERARTLVACASQLRVGIANLTHEVPRHVVDVDGSLIFLAPADSPASVLRLAPRLPSPTVTATATDVTVVPLAGCEATWLPHLHADHGGVLHRLASYAVGSLPVGTDVRPVVLDRHGVVLRLHAEGRSRDVRLAFAQAVTCGCDVRPAFDELLARARP